MPNEVKLMNKHAIAVIVKGLVDFHLIESWDASTVGETLAHINIVAYVKLRYEDSSDYVDFMYSIPEIKDIDYTEVCHKFIWEVCTDYLDNCQHISTSSQFAPTLLNIVYKLGHKARSSVIVSEKVNEYKPLS